MDNNDRIGPGDGLVVQGGSGIVVRENIITNNGKGVHVEQSSPLLIANDLWNNSSNYVGVGPGSGDLSQDPAYTCSLAGDLNCNGMVDLADVVLLAGHWDETTSASTWIPRFDLNADGRISIADVTLLTRGWNGQRP